MKYFKDYCQILSEVIKEAKRMEYNRHILNSNNVMRTLWKLIKKESTGVVNIMESSHLILMVGILQIIANAFNNHFATFPTTISRKINANNCSTTTSDNNKNDISFSLNHVYRNSFTNFKYCCTTTREIENIITLKLLNSCGYDEVPSKLLKLCSYYISAPLNYICNRTGVFPDSL
jgi:hypothetical protein